jgi:hypothetical protein
MNDPSKWSTLKPYITDVIGSFANDPRILAWDIWNEPVNEPNRTNPIVKLAFEWALSVNPIQPLTSPIWTNYDNKWNEIEQIQINNSDVISFHK